jgi:sulfate permease, SulP family
MVVNGSLSKTAVNGAAGAKSQVSGLVVAALTVVTLLFLTGLFEKLPEATLAAVVIAAVIELVDIAALRHLYQVWTRRLGGIYGLAARTDFIAAVAAMLGVLIFDTLPGLFIGIAVSILLLLYRASRPHIATLLEAADGSGTGGSVWVDSARHPTARAEPGVLILRVEAGLIFANADIVRQRIRAGVDDTTRAVVLDAETSPAIDVTATEMLAQLARELDGEGVALFVARGIGQVRDVIRTEHAEPGIDPVYPTVDAAVAAARQLPPRRPPTEREPPA